MGYMRAGFEVMGMDINPQPSYPFTFVQMDVMTLSPEFIAMEFDAVVASPPCQFYSITANLHTNVHPDLVAPTRALLRATGLPYVIENVPGAPLENPVVMCGSSFALPIRRHRLFESNLPLTGPACDHAWQNRHKPYIVHNSKARGGPARTGVVSVHGAEQHSEDGFSWRNDYNIWQASVALGIDWMKTKYELNQSIPPCVHLSPREAATRDDGASVIYIDLETRSRTDLKKLGVYRYTEDPDFRILMAGWSLGGLDEIQVAIGHDEILDIPGLLDPSVPKVAHNAQFERLCLGTLVSSLREPEQWIDTASIAAEYGYPTSLDGVAKALGVTEKDDAGKKLTKIFCLPNRDGSWNDATTHPMEWLDFLSYCAQDVGTMIEVHQKLGDWPTETERRVWVADQHINDRGMRIDLELCRVAAWAVAENKDEGKEIFTALTGVDNPASTQQVMAWAKEAGLDLPNLRAETLEAVIEDPEANPEHVRILELRQDLALAAGGKFSAALDVVSPDNRIRGGFRFFGAHTGRWTGQRVQPQNLPRATVDEPEAAILDLKLGLGADPHTLKALVRSMFIGPLTVVDYASIEARVVSWMANEEWALDAFAKGRDIYVETAERMSTPSTPLTRAQGKIAVLALGYNGGINSLRAMGAEGDDKALQFLVNTWRKANPRIVQLWATMQDAVGEGGRVGPHIKITRRGDSMKMHLPSGRAIGYHGVRWERYVVIDPKTGRKLFKEGWRYNDPKRGGARIGTYGGRLVENATQAIARDVMAEALVRLDEAGYPVVGHVHDEVIVESEELEEITRLMTQTPSWGRGLPIDGEGYVADRYKKS